MDSRAGRESDSSERSLVRVRADKYLKESRQAYAENLLAFAMIEELSSIATTFNRANDFVSFAVRCIDVFHLEWTAGVATVRGIFSDSVPFSDLFLEKR